jgi:hypothetical protein
MRAKALKKQPSANGQTKKKSFLSQWLQKGGRDLTLTSIICLLGFVVFFFPHSYIAEHYPKQHFLEQFLHEGSIAFMIAGILTATLEHTARRRAARESQEYAQSIGEDVFKEILHHLVPPEVFTEIDRLFKIKFIRRNCKYTITFTDKDTPPGLIAVLRELSFDVQNLSQEEIVFPIRSAYSGHPEITATKKEFHLQLKIEQEPILDLEPYIKQDASFIYLDYPLSIEPGDTVKVYMKGGELYATQPGSSSYIQGSVCDGLEVRIVNECRNKIKEVDLLMHHPAPKKEIVSNTKQDYSLKRAFLPGQGFEIRWTLHK